MSFYSEVIKADSRFLSPNPCRDLGLLELKFRAHIIGIISDASITGTRLVVLETFRSQVRQEALFVQGATQLREVGVHHYGLACDLGIMIGGQVNWKADYSTLGRLAKVRGLVWGGDWGQPDRPHSFRDYDHLQAIAVVDQERLFAGSWYPDDSYVPAQIG